jgi:hypothetical protein
MGAMDSVTNRCLLLGLPVCSLWSLIADLSIFLFVTWLRARETQTFYSEAEHTGFQFQPKIKKIYFFFEQKNSQNTNINKKKEKKKEKKI